MGADTKVALGAAATHRFGDTEAISLNYSVYGYGLEPTEGIADLYSSLIPDTLDDTPMADHPADAPGRA